MTDVLTTDVLVIGGGTAGTNAVLKAADQGAEVVMVVKGPPGQERMLDLRQPPALLRFHDGAECGPTATATPCATTTIT